MKNEYMVTKKRFLLWGIQEKVKPPRIYFIIFWTFLSILSLVLLIWEQNMPFNILIFAYCVYQAFIRDFVITFREYRKFAQSYERPEWQRMVTFNEIGIVVSEERTQNIYQYSDVKRIKVKNNKIKLVTKKTVIHMFMDAFVNGDWKQCQAFLEKKINQ